MEKVRRGAELMGVPLNQEQLRRLQRYQTLMLDWNQRFNLTAIDSPEQVEIRHFLDSLSCALALRKITASDPRIILGGAADAIDVGTGAGLPGIVIKIVWPALRLTLLEATGKKVEFLRVVCDELGLSDVTVVHARAEELAHDPVHRCRYDLAFARAVAPLPALLELTLPFLRVGGWLLAQKGPAAAAEALASERALSVLGGRLHQLIPVEVPFLAEERIIVAVQKERETPDRYPRRPGVPARRPL